MTFSITDAEKRNGYAGAGIILTRLTDSTPRYLLLKGADTGIWSFPKGHPEKVDCNAPLRTAVRETYEETGYECNKHYDIIGNSIRYGKRPYWIGIMRADTNMDYISISPREHSAAGWFTHADICKLNTNNDVRSWLKKAQSSVGRFWQTISSVAVASMLSTHSSAVACSAC